MIHFSPLRNVQTNCAVSTFKTKIYSERERTCITNVWLDLGISDVKSANRAYTCVPCADKPVDQHVTGLTNICIWFSADSLITHKTSSCLSTEERWIWILSLVCCLSKYNVCVTCWYPQWASSCLKKIILYCCIHVYVVISVKERGC